MATTINSLIKIISTNHMVKVSCYNANDENDNINNHDEFIEASFVFVVLYYVIVWSINKIKMIFMTHRL